MICPNCGSPLRQSKKAVGFYNLLLCKKGCKGPDGNRTKLLIEREDGVQRECLYFGVNCWRRGRIDCRGCSV